VRTGLNCTHPERGCLVCRNIMCPSKQSWPKKRGASDEVGNMNCAVHPEYVSGSGGPHFKLAEDRAPRALVARDRSRGKA